MSTEHQQYSTLNQADKIREYAERHCITIVKTYADDGKSGLRIDGRTGLKQLLDDVERGSAPFEVLLVYDISRWGRFQDADESAYYEYKCRRAGVRVIYCAEQFENDGSPTATIIKSVKRAMAGEYSRELSAKVFAGQCRLVELGYRQGGEPGYALRRLLIDQTGSIKGELRRGERKSLQTDRVILTPGPQSEVMVVGTIYDSFISGEAEAAIADRLNRRGIQNARGKYWTPQNVREILTNEKYTGANVYNRRSFKLKKSHIANPPEMWVRNDAAFEPVVSKELYQKAQQILRARSRRRTDEELLGHLSRIHESYGKLSGFVIDEDGAVSTGLIGSRFGSLRRAYEMIGYSPERDYSFIEINRRIRSLYPGIVDAACQQISVFGGCVQTDESSGLVVVNDEFAISLLISRCQVTACGSRRWTVRLCSSKADIILAIRLDQSNAAMRDCFLLPRSSLDARDQLNLRDFNHASIESFRFDTLDGLSRLAARTDLREI